jgi:hypothetical protein
VGAAINLQRRHLPGSTVRAAADAPASTRQRDERRGAPIDARELGHARLDIAGQMLVAFHDWTFLLGPQFCAGFGNGILLGYLMYKSELVPRRMALLGLIGGPLAFIGGVFVLFGAFDQPSGPLIALTAIEVAWEASLAIYLTVKGFRLTVLMITPGHVGKLHLRKD